VINFADCESPTPPEGPNSREKSPTFRFILWSVSLERSSVCPWRMKTVNEDSGLPGNLRQRDSHDQNHGGIWVLRKIW
jgi:hypothetical protein